MAYTTTNMGAAHLLTLTVRGVAIGGGTNSPYDFIVALEKQSHEIQQSPTAVLQSLLRRTVRSRVSLVEIPLSNLKVVYDLPDAQLVSSVLTIDDTSEGQVSYVAVGSAGSAPSSGTRTWTMPQTEISGEVSTTLDKAALQTLSVEFEHLAASGGDVGTIADS